MEQKQTSGHRLRFNHANSLPRYIVAVDTETRPVQLSTEPARTAQRFRLGVAMSCRYQRDKVSGKSTLRFIQRCQFWQWLYEKTRSNYTTWLVGHNLLFDLRQLDFVREMREGRLTLDAPRKKRNSEGRVEDDAWGQGICCIESPPTIIGLRCGRTQGRIICVDTMNWFPERLAVIGQELGLLKQQMPDWGESDDTWFDYCENDTEITLRIFIELMQWVRANNLGMFRYTVASQALSAYRHRYMPCAIYLHDNSEVKAMERLSYRGGRTECFRLGAIKETVYKVDINSLFPSTMRDCPTPYILKRFSLEREFSTTLPDIRWCDSLAAVAVRTPESIYPVERNGEVVYPVGVFRTWLCGQELYRAYSRGQIYAIAQWAEYDCAVLFREFVDELWALRRQYIDTDNTLYAVFAKRLMNALYGKFGQRASRWETVRGQEAPEAFATWCRFDGSTGTTRRYRSFGYTVQVQASKREIDSSFPAISAFITSAARCKMNALRKIAGKQDVLYQGVDSLIVTEIGRSRLLAACEIQQDTIGKLRIDGKANYGHIYGCSDYQLGDTIVIAGRSGRYETVDDTLFMQRKLQAQDGLFGVAVSPDIIESQQFWQRRKQYAKGIVRDDRWIDPIQLNEPLEPLTDVFNALSTAS